MQSIPRGFHGWARIGRLSSASSAQSAEEVSSSHLVAAPPRCVRNPVRERSSPSRYGFSDSLRPPRRLVPSGHADLHPDAHRPAARTRPARTRGARRPAGSSTARATSCTPTSTGTWRRGCSSSGSNGSLPHPGSRKANRPSPGLRTSGGLLWEHRFQLMSPILPKLRNPGQAGVGNPQGSRARRRRSSRLRRPSAWRRRWRPRRTGRRGDLCLQGRPLLPRPGPALAGGGVRRAISPA